MITVSRIRELLDYDAASGVLLWKKARSGLATAGSRAGSKNMKGYRMVSIDGTRYQEHRIVWAIVHGRILDRTVCIDHVNGQKDDNRIENLRLAESWQNSANMTITNRNTSGFKGVTFHKSTGKWQAVIMVRGVQKYLGLFKSAEDAFEAYSRESRKECGEFARF